MIFFKNYLAHNVNITFYFERLYRYRLLTNECQNKGFILDGFPETFDQARMLFMARDGDLDGEDPGEDGKDALDHRLVPGINEYKIFNHKKIFISLK